MENEKEYIVTIDGTDCSGKSTLWKQANEYNKNIQVRGILSNIAYGLKYNRNIDEMIDLYNENPVNYVVYLLNPINDKKLEMLYNRLRNNVYNNDFIEKELLDASKTWKDYDYFKRAKDILLERYKGEIKFEIVNNNNFDDFKEYINNIKIKEIDKSLESSGIKVIDSTIDNFEATAKEVSEFKYIVFINKVDKEKVIENLSEGLDDEYKELLNNLYEYTSETASDIYDYLEDYTVESLVDYLDNYEIRAEVNVRCEVDTYSEVYIPLRDTKGSRCLEDVIYDDSCLMDDLYDAAKDDVYNTDLEIEVGRTY